MFDLLTVRSTLDKYGLSDRFDAKKVLLKMGGRRPGKRCKRGWIAAEKQCSDHKTADGKLTAAGKSSARELAARVRDRKGMQDKNEVTRKRLVGLDDRIESEQKARTARKTAATKARNKTIAPSQLNAGDRRQATQYNQQGAQRAKAEGRSADVPAWQRQAREARISDVKSRQHDSG